MKQLYRALKIRMIESDLTQSEISEKAGISYSTLSGRMMGRRPFTALEMQRIGDVLGIPAEEYHLYFFPQHKEVNPGKTYQYRQMDR